MRGYIDWKCAAVTVVSVCRNSVTAPRTLGGNGLATLPAGIFQGLENLGGL